MYDIIGDVHGHCDKLQEMLIRLDYSKVKGVWKHPERTLIFVGDYIDRGPKIRETLQLIRDMVEAGNAIALMGNHEYNAIAYATPSGDGSFLRKHNDAHTKQHRATLDQFANHREEWASYLAWLL